MSTKRSSISIALFSLFLAAPLYVHASVRITEIMYDLEGTDAGREWVEVANDGSDPVDIAAFRLFEGGTNHRLTSVQGSTVLAPGSAAVIADDSTKFLADWSSYTGMLFDTSFAGGLSNSGEVLTLRNGDLADADSVTYASGWGGAGDGNSLTRLGSSFSGAVPSPGVYGGADSSGAQAQSQESTSSSSDTSVTPAAVAPQKMISVYAGDARSVTVGADSVYRAEVFGTSGEKASSPRVVWNFGDGTIQEGVSVAHAYAYPGKYAVLVSGSLGEYSALARFTVVALPAEVSLRVETDGTLSVLNTGARDADISRWIVTRNGFDFRFPEGTIVLAGEGVHLPATTHIPSSGEALLRYPNGMPASGEVPALEHIPVAKVPTKKATASGIVAGATVVEAASVEAVARSGSQAKSKGSALLWLMGALAVALLGTAGALFLRQQMPKAESADDIASTYEIIE